MGKIVPRQSLEKGTVEFDLLCECGEMHRVKVQPSNITFGITLVDKKKRPLDHISVQPTPTFRPRTVA